MTRHDGAGRRAEAEYKRLKKAWQRRVFGRLVTWFWPVFAPLVIVATLLPKPISTIAIGALGVVALAWLIIKEFGAPDHIERWQRGAWGEQYVAKMLKPLKKEGWVIRHDLWTGRGNRDHVVVGGSGVYLLDTKFHAQDELMIEGDALRVRRIDQPRDSYLIDGLTRSMRGAAAGLSREIEAATGERVFVHPVVVLHGTFDAEVEDVSGVSYVASDHVAEWLRRRPASLSERRRAVVAEWLRGWTTVVERDPTPQPVESR